MIFLIIYAIIMLTIVLFFLAISSAFMLLVRFFCKAVDKVIELLKNGETNDKI